MSAVRICQLADAACSMGCSEFECRHGRPARRSVTSEEDAALRRAAIRAGKTVGKGAIMSDTMRDAFEKIFPMPRDCIWTGNGYAATGYNAWDAQAHCERWKGWQAAQTQPAPPEIVFPAEPVNDDAALESAWQTLRPQLETSGWTVSDAFNNRGFFAWGWEARHQYTPAAQSQPAPMKLPKLPEPDTTHYAQWAGDRIKYHSVDQIIEFANARVTAALAAAQEGKS